MGPDGQKETHKIQSNTLQNTPLYLGEVIFQEAFLTKFTFALNVLRSLKLGISDVSSERNSKASDNICVLEFLVFTPK
jgi:hypothetical protein